MQHPPPRDEQLAVLRNAFQKARLSIYHNQQQQQNRHANTLSSATVNAALPSSNILLPAIASPGLFSCLFGRFECPILTKNAATRVEYHTAKNKPSSSGAAAPVHSGLYLGMRTSQLRRISLDAIGSLPQEIRIVSLEPNAVCRLLKCHNRMYNDMYVGELYTYVPEMILANANVVPFVLSKFHTVSLQSPRSNPTTDTTRPSTSHISSSPSSSSVSLVPSAPPSQSLALMIAMDANDAEDIAHKKEELNLPATPALQHHLIPDKYVWLTNRHDSTSLLREGTAVRAFNSKPIIVSFADIVALFSSSADTEIMRQLPSSLANLVRAVAAGEMGLVSGMYIGRDALELQSRLLLQRQQSDSSDKAKPHADKYVTATLSCIDAMPVDYAFMRLLERWDDNAEPSVVQIKTKAFFRVVSWANDQDKKDLICVVPRNRDVARKAGDVSSSNAAGSCASAGITRMVLTYASEGGFINRAALPDQSGDSSSFATSSSSSSIGDWLYLPTFADVVAFLQDPRGCIKRDETMTVSDADMKSLLFTLYKGNFYVAQHVEIDIEVQDDDQELTSSAPVDTLMHACELLTAECKTAITSDIAAGPAQGEAAFDSFVGKANDMLATSL